MATIARILRRAGGPFILMGAGFFLAFAGLAGDYYQHEIAGFSVALESFFAPVHVMIFAGTVAGLVHDWPGPEGVGGLASGGARLPDAPLLRRAGPAAVDLRVLLPDLGRLLAPQRVPLLCPAHDARDREGVRPRGPHHFLAGTGSPHFGLNRNSSFTNRKWREFM